MIFHGYIEIHPKGCEDWIIVMRFRVLLVTHYLIREILMEAILDINEKRVRITNF
jgi:hypothetical protein